MLVDGCASFVTSKYDRNEIAAAMAALPWTTACSPKTITFPGAETMKECLASIDRAMLFCRLNRMKAVNRKGVSCSPSTRQVLRKPEKRQTDQAGDRSQLYRILHVFGKGTKDCHMTQTRQASFTARATLSCKQGGRLVKAVYAVRILSCLTIARRRAITFAIKMGKNVFDS